MSRKRQTIFLIGLFIVFVVVSCGKSKKSPDRDASMEKSLIEVSIGGMTCTGCEQTIQAGITKLEGIESVKASYVTGNALVEYFPGITDTVKIKNAITGSGYTVKRFKPVPENTTTE
jgi:copper chaperone CopZ